ncbi:class I SAM-dependent methyltransferase [Micromonospora sp. NBC_01813]|uniref:class I SAM-dependent methyltransferase n=1 Tax=Micromonospora sp. NBC_01813 TaxID=2975988 RepID=UPI002DD81E57|nr:class I SAM-dependent methyltransferase [Micromonospora sp. NBC_01813]WSA09962.1 class I SAM-dependent methyltransferase [Micromonospora sp. NBC_01813]
MTAVAAGWPGTAQVRRSYAALVEHYTAMTADYGRFPGLRQELMAFLAELVPGPVLDLGCGAGRDADLAAASGRTVVLADVTPELLRATTARIAVDAAVCCDALALPLRADAFAGVIASGVLLHLPRQYTVTALDNIRRVLMPGGKALISMKHGSRDGWRSTDDFPAPRWFSYYEPEEFAVLCRKVGLRVAQLDVSSRKDWFTATTERLEL